MDELLNKYLGEEINEVEFNTRLTSFTDDERKEFDVLLAKPETASKISAKAKETLDKVSALRKESKRIGDKDKPVDHSEKFREENIEKATKTFFTKFNIPQTEQAEYIDSFRRNDSGNVSPDLIFGDLKKIYAVRHADELLSTKEEYDSFQENAQDFNRNSAGAPGGAGSGGVKDDTRVSQASKEWVKEAAKQGVVLDEKNITRTLSEGMTRTF